ncbi:MAG: SGNH/GDSL hydrolase family protein [Planctomycetota bacterium JB042]
MSDPVTTPRGTPRFLKLLFSLAVALFVWIVLVEGVLRFVPVEGFTKDDLDPPMLTDESKLRNRPHPYLAYSLTPGYRSFKKARSQASHNSLGFRGPETTWWKPEGVYRIACLGGSSTYGHTPSSDATTWPARLEHHLEEAYPDRRIEVVNAGTSGYSTFESIANLAFRVVEFQPDLVIVYHSINDMRCLLYPDPRPDNTHWRAVWSRTRESPIERWLAHSMTYLIARKHLTDYLERSRELGGVVIVDYEEKVDKYARSLEGVDFSVFERNLRTLAAIARGHGAEILFSTQGFERRDIGGPSRKAQVEAMGRMKEILKRFGRREGVAVVEGGLALEIEAAKQRNATGEQRIFSHEVHLFDEGTDLLARTLAEEIRKRGWLD